jgi:hypothetical protein
MSAIHFIGGEKGGVGKSVVSRLLAQYFIDKNQLLTVVDADRSHGAMLRFYSDFSVPGDLDNFETSDQILQLALDADRRVIVDLPAQSDRLLRKWMEQNGIVELAAESQVPLYFWHVMDDGKDSVNLLQNLVNVYGSSVKYVLVKNMGRGKDFSEFDASEAKKNAERAGAQIITLDDLHAPTMKKIDSHSSSFWAASNNSTMGMIERHRVKVWIKKVFQELEKIGV